MRSRSDEAGLCRPRDLPRRSRPREGAVKGLTSKAYAEKQRAKIDLARPPRPMTSRRAIRCRMRATRPRIIRWWMPKGMRSRTPIRSISPTAWASSRPERACSSTTRWMILRQARRAERLWPRRFGCEFGASRRATALLDDADDPLQGWQALHGHGFARRQPHHLDDPAGHHQRDRFRHEPRGSRGRAAHPSPVEAGCVAGGAGPLAGYPEAARGSRPDRAARVRHRARPIPSCCRAAGCKARQIRASAALRPSVTDEGDQLWALAENAAPSTSPGASRLPACTTSAKASASTRLSISGAIATVAFPGGPDRDRRDHAPRWHK